MTHYPDLSTHCMVDWGPRVRAIGWLCQFHTFTRGPVTPEFLDALTQHLKGPQLIMCLGVHECDLCPPRRGNTFFGGSQNIWIPTESCVYVAPELVVHYIRDHSYRPPGEFMTAVMTAPPQDSPEFWALMERNSGFLARQREGEIRARENAKIKRGHCAGCGSIGALDDNGRCYDCAPNAFGADEVTDGGGIRLHDTGDITDEHEPV